MRGLRAHDKEVLRNAPHYPDKKDGAGRALDQTTLRVRKTHTPEKTCASTWPAPMDIAPEFPSVTLDSWARIMLLAPLPGEGHIPNGARLFSHNRDPRIHQDV